MQTLANAGVTSSAVAGGDLQIGATTCLNVAQAREHNLPFIGVVPGAVQAAHQNNGGLIVAPNSPIATTKDLNGKSIAIETLNGLAALTIKAMVDQAGGDSSTLQFVEMGGALMTDAVLNGRVPGAYLQDPFYTQNLSRLRSLGSPNDAVGGTYVSIVWFTTTDWLAKNKDTARKFANAIYASGQWAMSNPQLAAASLDKHLGIKVPAATQRFATQLDINAFRRLFDLAAKYKFIAPWSILRRSSGTASKMKLVTIDAYPSGRTGVLVGDDILDFGLAAKFVPLSAWVPAAMPVLLAAGDAGPRRDPAGRRRRAQPLDGRATRDARVARHSKHTTIACWRHRCCRACCWRTAARIRATAPECARARRRPRPTNRRRSLPRA